MVVVVTNGQHVIILEIEATTRFVLGEIPIPAMILQGINRIKCNETVITILVAGVANQHLMLKGWRVDTRRTKYRKARRSI